MEKIDTATDELVSGAMSDVGEHLDAAAWRAFVASEIEDSCRPYLAKPEFLLGHFRVERQAADDYAGRELLELDLAGRSVGIARICKLDEEKPVPVLAFPATGNLIERLAGGRCSALLSHARMLRSRGYDTVVVAPFDNVRAFDRAVGQASEFEPTFLLFIESARAPATIHCNAGLADREDALRPRRRTGLLARRSETGSHLPVKYVKVDSMCKRASECSKTKEIHGDSACYSFAFFRDSLGCPRLRIDGQGRLLRNVDR